MRALIVSKAFVSSMYRKKLTELANLGVEVIGVAPPEWREREAAQKLEAATDEGFELLVSPLRFNGHFHVHYYPHLPDVITRTRPDIVHLDEEPYNVATYLGIRAAHRAGIPALFFTWQNLLRTYPPPFRLMEHRVYNWVSEALSGSEEAKYVLKKRGFSKRVTVIPQFGVDPDAFVPAERPERPFTVGILNRLIPAKAPLLVLRAFAHLPDAATLRVVGNGPEHDGLCAEVARLGLTQRVHITGRIPSTGVPSLMHDLDVVVLPSLTTARWKEQFGRVLIEAMASGVPVVGSNSGEIPHVIGDAGLIVPEGDESALAAALSTLQADQTLRARLSERGRSRVLALYTHRRIAEKTLEVYGRLTSN